MKRVDLSEAIEKFYQISDQMPASYILTLLWVAQNPDGNQLDLEKYLGTSNATTSRAVKYWSQWKSPRQSRVTGAVYVEIYQDPLDRRYNRLRLTDAGRAFIDALIERA